MISFFRQAGGRPAKLDEAARQALVKKLEAEAISTGFPIEQCKQAQVKQVIEQALGLVCRPHDIGDGLHLVSSGSGNIAKRLLQTF